MVPAGGVLEGDETLLSEDAGLRKGHERKRFKIVNIVGVVLFRVATVLFFFYYCLDVAFRSFDTRGQQYIKYKS